MRLCARFTALPRIRARILVTASLEPARWQALTDPVVMSNYETYGNPDGPQFVKEYLVPSFCKRRNGADHHCKDNRLRQVELHFPIRVLLLMTHEQ